MAWRRRSSRRGRERRRSADATATDRAGRTPLHYAALDDDLTRNARDDGEVIVLLLAHGADPDHANRTGISPRGVAETVATHDLLPFYAD